jgi:hypothetical protein
MSQHPAANSKNWIERRNCRSFSTQIREPV